MRYFRLALALAAPALMLCQDAATLSGVVVDPSHAVVPGTHIVMVDLNRGVVRTTVSGAAGGYFFASLPPGDYSLEAEKPGFSKLRIDRIRLNARDRQSLTLALELAPGEATVITVSAGMGGISSDPSAGAAIDRDFAGNLPLNGRDAGALVRMAPGVTANNEQINVNGLRSNTNYYTMDGVSADIAVNGAGRGFGGGGRGFGGMSGRGGPPGGGRGLGGPAGGSGTDLLALDSLEEVRIQTSAIAPEFGRSPGAQVSLTSRSGSNEFHGSAYEYFRNDKLNANDWFANEAGNPRGAMRHNEFGGSLGGPLQRNRTYFFASYEGLRSEHPQTALADVPDLGTRQASPPEIRAYLDAFPIPNGPLLDGGAARFTAVVPSRSTTDYASLRLDHQISDTLTAFARYSFAPYARESRGIGVMAPNSLTAMDGKSHALTNALTWTPSPLTANDLRVNFSAAPSNSYSVMDGFGGAVPLTDDLLFPAGITSANGSFSLMVAGAGGYSHGAARRSRQQQINIVDSLTHTSGAHNLKFGVDYRRLSPTEHNQAYQASVIFNGLGTDEGGLLSGVATNAVVVSSEPAVYPLYRNFSMYGQDTWKANERTTLTYGLRWDVNPAPDVKDGPPLIALSGSGMFASVTRLDPLYRTRWGDVAPRLGLAYQIDTTPGREMMFRIGAGLFHDIGYGTTTGAFNGAPFNSQRTLTEPKFPLSAGDLEPPPLPATRPYGRISAADPYLKSPRIYQWHMTLERMLGHAQSFIVGYVGTAGRDLLQVEARRSFASSGDDGEEEGSADYDVLSLASNGASSDYHGLQVQFRRRLSRSFQTQLSYTWSHSIDSASNDVAPGGGFATLMGNERGDSSFDVRQYLSFSGSLALPAPRNRVLKMFLGNWWSEWVVTARTGTPFDVRGISGTTSEEEEDDDEDMPRGLFAQVRPDYTGEPVWISDPAAPGARRLNPDAFELPDEFEQGNLGRNVLRGFSMLQTDFSLRRQFVIHDHWRLHAMFQAFNVFNHPNFMNPSADEGANLASPSFGLATRMSSGGGFGSRYQTGGPRSLQIAVRLQF